MKPKRRRLASVELELSRIAIASPAPERYEVIRTHAATGRTQLHAWNFIVKGAAENEARTMNEVAAKDGGRTRATSGHDESGWRYEVRGPGAPPEGKRRCITAPDERGPRIDTLPWRAEQKPLHLPPRLDGKGKDYARAVFDSQRERTALAAALGDS